MIRPDIAASRANERPEEARRITAQLIRSYERTRHAPHTEAYRVAYARLAARVREASLRWVQAEGVRYIWSRSEQALLRQVIAGPQPGHPKLIRL